MSQPSQIWGCTGALCTGWATWSYGTAKYKSGHTQGESTGSCQGPENHPNVLRKCGSGTGKAWRKTVYRSPHRWLQQSNAEARNNPRWFKEQTPRTALTKGKRREGCTLREEAAKCLLSSWERVTCEHEQHQGNVGMLRSYVFGMLIHKGGAAKGRPLTTPDRLVHPPMSPLPDSLRTVHAWSWTTDLLTLCHAWTVHCLPWAMPRRVCGYPRYPATAKCSMVPASQTFVTPWGTADYSSRIILKNSALSHSWTIAHVTVL